MTPVIVNISIDHINIQCNVTVFYSSCPGLTKIVTRLPSISIIALIHTPCAFLCKGSNKKEYLDS